MQVGSLVEVLPRLGVVASAASYQASQMNFRTRKSASSARVTQEVAIAVLQVPAKSLEERLGFDHDAFILMRIGAMRSAEMTEAPESATMCRLCRKSGPAERENERTPCLRHALMLERGSHLEFAGSCRSSLCRPGLETNPRRRQSRISAPRLATGRSRRYCSTTFRQSVLPSVFSLST